jgi:hypothetical protein
MKDNDVSHTAVLSLSRFARNPSPALEKEKDAAEAYQEARAGAREAPMLDVVFTDGRIESFDYSLPKRVTFLPEGKLILRFGNDSIMVVGVNLTRIREQIVEGRRRFIRVGTEAEQDVNPEEAPYIERIEITEADS